MRAKPKTGKKEFDSLEAAARFLHRKSGEGYNVEVRKGRKRGVWNALWSAGFINTRRTVTVD